jgi:hypothetical protein
LRRLEKSGLEWNPNVKKNKALGGPGLRQIMMKIGFLKLNLESLKFHPASPTRKNFFIPKKIIVLISTLKRVIDCLPSHKKNFTLTIFTHRLFFYPVKKEEKIKPLISVLQEEAERKST